MESMSGMSSFMSSTTSRSRPPETRAFHASPRKGGSIDVSERKRTDRRVIHRRRGSCRSSPSSVTGKTNSGLLRELRVTVKPIAGAASGGRRSLNMPERIFSSSSSNERSSRLLGPHFGVRAVQSWPRARKHDRRTDGQCSEPGRTPGATQLSAFHPAVGQTPRAQQGCRPRQAGLPPQAQRSCRCCFDRPRD